MKDEMLKAKVRNNFRVFDDWHLIFDSLSDEQCGKVFKSLLAYRRYVKGEAEKPEPLEDPILNGICTSFCLSIERG